MSPLRAKYRDDIPGQFREKKSKSKRPELNLFTAVKGALVPFEFKNVLERE